MFSPKASVQNESEKKSTGNNINKPVENNKEIVKDNKEEKPKSQYMDFGLGKA